MSVSLSWLGNRVFVDTVKMGSLGWATIQYDWCPYKTRRSPGGDRDSGGQTAVWMEAEPGVWQKQAKSTGNRWQPSQLAGGSEGPSPAGFRGNTGLLTTWCPSLGSRTRRQYISVLLSHPICGTLYLASNPKKLIHTHLQMETFSTFIILWG